MTTKSTASTLLVLLVLLSASVAGVARGGQHPHDDRPARREISAYYQANVLPVLRQQRQQLESQLAPADRTQLAAYRTQLQGLKAQGQALRQSLRPAGPPPGTRPELTEAQREQLHQLRTETRRIMKNVGALAQQYEVPLRQLAQEMQPQREKWAAEIKAIALKNATPEQRERLAAPGGHLRGPGGRHHFFRAAHFLLLDPNAAAGPAERALGSTSFYPNPTTATSQLEYEVKKAGPVTIDLLDKNGTKLRTLLAETSQEKGPRTQQLDLRDLPAGTYFYKITTRSGSETKRFVKE